MAFSIKQLLFWMAITAFGLVAMLSEYRPVLGKLFDLLTLGILIAMAYGVWLASGERRAFRVGFLCWGLLYLFLFKKSFDVGIPELVRRGYDAIQAKSFVPVQISGFGGGGMAGGGFGGGGSGGAFRFPYSNFAPVCHSLVLLLLGLVGGWVTVYFYRKRQRMLAK